MKKLLVLLALFLGCNEPHREVKVVPKDEVTKYTKITNIHRNFNGSFSFKGYNNKELVWFEDVRPRVFIDAKETWAQMTIRGNHEERYLYELHVKAEEELNER